MRILAGIDPRTSHPGLSPGNMPRTIASTDSVRGQGAPRLNDTTCVRRTIDRRSIWSAHCQKRHSRASSRPSAPKPRPSSTIPPFPARRRISFGRRLKRLSPGTRRARRPRARGVLACRRNDAVADADPAGLRRHRQQRARRLHRGQGARQGRRPAQVRRPHDKGQWDKLKSLPISSTRTATGSASGERRTAAKSLLEGDIETSGAKLKAPEPAPARRDFLSWAPNRRPAPGSWRKPAPASAVCCATRFWSRWPGHGSLQLKEDWRKLLFPEARDAQFADGYAQAVTFGLLMARPTTYR